MDPFLERRGVDKMEGLFIEQELAKLPCVKTEHGGDINYYWELTKHLGVDQYRHWQFLLRTTITTNRSFNLINSSCSLFSSCRLIMIL
jgi:hypothetical protein